MTKSCLDLIVRALLRLKVVASGDEPSADQAADGMLVLQGIYSHLVETGAFGPRRRVLLTANYTAGENEKLSGAFAVTLPLIINDCETGDDRAPRDRAIVQIAGNVTSVDGIAVAGPQTWLYDDTLAAWVALHDLETQSDAPLGDRFFEGLAAMLAVQYADDFDAPLTQTIADSARRGKYAITVKGFAAPPVDSALLRTSNRRFGGMLY